MKKHISATLASVKSLISHGTNRRQNITHDFINIGPGGFCDCNDNQQARNYPEGTVMLAEAMLAYAGMSDMGAIYTKGDDNLYVTYTYEIRDSNFCGAKVDREYLLGKKTDWPLLKYRAPELAQMVNSALNIFPWDMTPDAIKERSNCEQADIDEVMLINQETVVIELGVSTDGSGRNIIKRVLEPGDHDYLRVMSLDPYVQQGTGLSGKHVPQNTVVIKI